MQRVLFAIVLVLIAGCGSRHEIARTPSPDGALDAVLAEVVGAPRAGSYEVYVVRRGATLGRSRALVGLEGVARSGEAAGARLRWLDPETLAVEYLSAQAVTVNSSEARLGERRVRIVPRAGESQRTPAGS
jgi:hypothetical protein